MKPLTRRHLLTGSALGLAGLTGCLGNTPYTRGDDTTPRVTPPPMEDTEPDGNYWDDHNGNQPIRFNSTVEYRYNEISTLNSLPPEIIDSYNDDTYIYHNHPHNTHDGRIIIEDESTARAHLLNAHVTDPLTAILYIRDDTGTFQRKTTTLTPPATDDYTTHTLTFDISDVSLPTQAGGYALLCLKDPEDDDEDERFITHHQFVRIPSKHGLKYINDHTLATRMYHDDLGPTTRDPRGVSVNGRQLNDYQVPAGAMFTEDDEDGRTVFLVARNTETNELMGASCYIKHEPIEKWDAGGDVDNKNSYRYKHRMVYEARYATHLDFLKELAHSTHEAVTNLGMTTQYEKLSALCDFIQMIPYEIDHLEPPSVVLYKTHGDCETKSHVLGGILRNDPWNVKHAYVDCYLKNFQVGHQVVGIADDELDGMPADLREKTPTYSFSKTERRNGFPSNEYALVDATSDWAIGDDSNLTDINVEFVGDYSNRNYGISNKKPDY